MFDTLLFFDGFGPMQVAIVLLIALIVFGPKRLPDIGRQIGTAIRELKKAGSEMVNSFNADHEPDRNAYPYSNGASQYDGSSYSGPSYYSYPAAGMNDPPDLTDYTIAGLPPADTVPHTRTPVDLTDYTLAGGSSGQGASDNQATSAVASEAQKQGDS